MAEHLCARSEHYIVANGRMSFARLFASTTQGYTLVYRDVIADNTGFPNNHSHAVVNENAPPNLRSRMDLDAGEEARHLREKTDG